MSESVIPVIFNQSNAVSGSNNQYTINLPTNYFAQKEEVALSNLQINYSWPNINATNYNNNVFGYTWVDGTVVSITLPNGFYQVSDLANYLQTIVMFTNGHYLIDDNNVNHYYINLETNSVAYAVSVICTPLPASLPSDWSYPSGASWTCNSKIPQFTVPNNNFQNIIGFSAGSYPATLGTGSTYIANSSFTPQVSPVVAVNVCLSMVNLPQFNKVSNSIYTFGIGSNTSYGSQISVVPPTLIYYRILDGPYYQFTMSFFDQLFNPLPILDTALTATIVLRKRV